MIKSIPIEENPREKALTHGLETLSNIELLAIILRTGNKNENVLDLASRLLNEIGGMKYFNDVSYGLLTSIKGIKQAKAIEILAVIEIARRMHNVQYDQVSFNHPNIIYSYLKNKMMFMTQEHFVILCLDAKCKLIKEKTLFIGTSNMSLISPKDIFKEAMSVNSVFLILVHNHPSGDSTPSKEDISITETIKQSGKMLGIKILDHIIIGKGEYYSFEMDEIIKI